MTLQSTASGVIAIAPTPFLEDGAIDWPSLDRLADFYVQTGCNGFTILGVLGEAPKLEASEALAIARRAIARAAGKPVIVGVSAPGFAAMRSLARQVMEMGAAGVMIAPNAALRTEDQIAQYFRDGVEAIGEDIPWVLQDYPLVTGVTMAPSLIQRIVNENESLKIIKHEDWPGLEKISALRKFEASGAMRRTSILVGNNGLFLDFEMARGADGANTGYAFPDMLVEIVRLMQNGQRDDAQDVFDMHLPLLRYEHQQGVGLAVRKYVLMRRGVLSSAALRKPGAALGAVARAEVDYLLARLGRRDARYAVPAL